MTTRTRRRILAEVEVDAVLADMLKGRSCLGAGSQGQKKSCRLVAQGNLPKLLRRHHVIASFRPIDVMELSGTDDYC